MLYLRSSSSMSRLDFFLLCSCGLVLYTAAIVRIVVARKSNINNSSVLYGELKRKREHQKGKKLNIRMDGCMHLCQQQNESFHFQPPSNYILYFKRMSKNKQGSYQCVIILLCVARLYTWINKRNNNSGTYFKKKLLFTLQRNCECGDDFFDDGNDTCF